MPHYDSHAPGSPTWIELGTRDQAAAKKFYQELLGWDAMDNDMPQGGSYTMFLKDGRMIGGGYTMTPDMPAPPHWMVYFESADADATVAKAAGLGATVLMPPFDVMDFGRMAVLQEPGGAVFSLWQSKANKGFGIANEPNTLCWSELNSKDLDKSKDFYTSLFGWSTTPHAGSPSPYLLCSNGDSPFGGMMQMTAEWGETPPHWIIYFQAADCKALAERVKALGGKVNHGPFEAPTVGWIAICEDPTGANFNLIQLTGAA